MPEPGQEWTCRLLMDAGKPDPEWIADAQTAANILQYCDAAKPYEHVFDIPVMKGYHGVSFFNSRTSITAFKGKMEIRTGNQTILKTDLGRKLEQMILHAAPAPHRSVAMLQLTTDFD